MPLPKDDPKLAAHACGRRNEGMGLRAFNPDNSQTPDTWRVTDSGWHTCSYCGSLHPDEFFELVDQGAEVGPTDKSYKAYIDLPDPNPQRMVIRVSQNFEPEDKTGWLQLTAENIDESYVDEWRRREFKKHQHLVAGGFEKPKPGEWVKPEPAGPIDHGKFYFQHLSDEHMNKFIDYLNGKKMKIGRPGYFYSRPFFIAPPKPKTEPAEG